MLIQPVALSRANDQLTAIVSILPQAYFLKRIGAEHIDVSVMVPEGGNPHTYEPTPTQLKKVSHAQLYVKMGSGIDFERAWMSKITYFNPDMTVCDSSQGIHLLEMKHDDPDFAHKKKDRHRVHHHGTKDPHIWLSPSNAIIMVENMKSSLAELDPAHRAIYEENTRELVADLLDLKQELSSHLETIAQREFFIVHPAWGYFANEFHLKQRAIEDFGKDPTPRQLTKIVHDAKKLNARIIFISPQFNSKNAKVIAREINGTVATIDPLAYGSAVRWNIKK